MPDGRPRRARSRAPEVWPSRSRTVAFGSPLPRRVPAVDRIVEAQLALLGELERERRGGDLGDAVERAARCAGVIGRRGSIDRVADRARPLAPAGEDDRGRDARHARLGLELLGAARRRAPAPPAASAPARCPGRPWAAAEPPQPATSRTTHQRERSRAHAATLRLTGAAVWITGALPPARPPGAGALSACGAPALTGSPSSPGGPASAASWCRRPSRAGTARRRGGRRPARRAR